MRRRARSVALLAGVAITLSAVPAVAQDDATITYRNWYHGGSMETVWNDYIASYEALNPDSRSRSRPSRSRATTTC